ncbi:hypothetical protein [Sporosarcina sp. P20a]|uniref:hypothetical protein n=1 Tax=Sporosarcina sp. P20a TaxID=2048256 RepID=UPI0013046428|nr:hypothetical protein [Sporosarcina sp. P20a]
MLLSLGCSNDSKEIQSKKIDQVNFELIASEKSLPSHIHEFAFQRKEAPVYTYWVKMVSDESDFEVAWNIYEMEDDMPDVDFDKKNVYFIGVQESGSCPYTEKSIKVDSDSKTLQVLLTESEGECTSDATPRTFVIQGDKNMEKVVITQGSTETSIPIKE